MRINCIANGIVTWAIVICEATSGIDFVGEGRFVVYAADLGAAADLPA